VERLSSAAVVSGLCLPSRRLRGKLQDENMNSAIGFGVL
jgi:hypothetical protein